MKADYNRDIFKQLEETLNRLDKMESTLDRVKAEHKIEIACLNELAEYDSLISMLVEVSPKEIILHNWKKYKNSEIPETLINIFDDRVKYIY